MADVLHYKHDTRTSKGKAVRVLTRFRRLQWKLTLSYTVTTVLADLCCCW
jgi:hypothetical protein